MKFLQANSKVTDLGLCCLPVSQTYDPRLSLVEETRFILFLIAEMYQCREALALILLLRLTSAATDCPAKCQCEETKVNCTDLIPNALSRNINKVVIFNPTKETLVPRAFCGILWPNVTWLTMNRQSGFRYALSL